MCASYLALKKILRISGEPQSVWRQMSHTELPEYILDAQALEQGPHPHKATRAGAEFLRSPVDRGSTSIFITVLTALHFDNLPAS